MKNPRLLFCTNLFSTVILPAVALLSSVYPANASVSFTPPVDEITRIGKTKGPRWTPNPERGSARSTLPGGRH